MNSFEQIMTAITFSYNSMTVITWLVLIFGVFKAVGAFNKAYEKGETYTQMRQSSDKSSVTQFYYGVIISILCVVIFFLPYFFILKVNN